MEEIKRLRELIYTSNDDLEITREIRKAIQEGIKKRRVEGGKDFFVKQTQQMDQMIRLIYEYLLKKNFREYRPLLSQIPIGIVALGSYGREQLSIYSDIDLMLLYEDIPGYNLEHLLENFIQMVWDLGLRVGHRVHQVEELVEVGLSDITIRTALLESRFIGGSKLLWAKAENQLSRLRHTNRRQYLWELYTLYLKRHRQYPISMEPNIKEGTGGIRDANTLYWIVKTLFNYPNSSYLVPQFITEEEYSRYRESLEFLFKVRVYLHLAAKRKVEEVRLEYQREIARNLGYRDTPRLPAERRFIRDLLARLWEINIFTHKTIRKIIKGYLRGRCPLPKVRAGRVAPGFSVVDGVLSAKFHPLLPVEERWEVIEKTRFDRGDISVVAAIEQFHPTPADLIPLLATGRSYPKLILLYKARLIEKLIPPFKRIKHLAQFDGYHHYPVDIHSLYTLKEVEGLKESNSQLVREVASSLTEREWVVLKLAALLHDIGKGLKEDHSIVGARIARHFCRQLGLPEEEVEVVARLVRYHTLMSQTAQKEDIYNDRVLLRFGEIVKEPLFLKLLFLLTLADIGAVGPGVLTNFKLRLLTTLYLNTLELLSNQELLSEVQRRHRKEQLLQRHPDFLKLPPVVRRWILESPSNQLFLQNRVEEILKIGEWLAELREKGEPYDYRIVTEKILEVEILKREGLNFSIGWFIDKLYRFNLKHLSIYRLGQFKYFRLEFEEGEGDYYLYDIQLAIEEGFKGFKPLEHRVQFPVESLEMDCDYSLNYGALRVEIEDQKGIVSTILQEFDRYRIWVEDLKISTIRGVASDLFIFSKEGGSCSKIPELLYQLTKDPKVLKES